jgi:hypothetical protein
LNNSVCSEKRADADEHTDADDYSYGYSAVKKASGGTPPSTPMMHQQLQQMVADNAHIDEFSINAKLSEKEHSIRRQLFAGSSCVNSTNDNRCEDVNK